MSRYSEKLNKIRKEVDMSLDNIEKVLLKAECVIADLNKNEEKFKNELNSLRIKW